MNFFSHFVENSFLIQVHPLVKLLASLLVFIYCLTVKEWLPLAVFLLCFLSFLFFAGLGKSIVRVLPLALLLGGSILVVNFLLGGAGIAGLVSALRIFCFFLSFLLFGATTCPASFMRALNQLKVPSSLSIGMLISLRFVPVLQQEMEKIIQSFSLRLGHRRGEWNLAYRGLMVPFVFKMLTVSDSLTLALQMRAFGTTTQRTNYQEVKIKVTDWLFLLTIILVMVGIEWML